MNSDKVDDEVEYLQCRVTADMIKSYCGRGSQSLRGNSLPSTQRVPLSVETPYWASTWRPESNGKHLEFNLALSDETLLLRLS